MNSIRRPRRRPRVDSMNFRTFFWVLLREAALRIAYPSSLGAISERAARVECSDRSSTRIASVCTAVIKQQPHRRYFP